jgi:altronate hydrolase
MNAPLLPKALKLHPSDDVVIAIAPLARGAVLDTVAEPVVVERDVAAGHKIAVRAVAVGEPVRRYGQVIGVASAAIRPGDHVHVHNLRLPERARFEVLDGASDDASPAATAPGAPMEAIHFDGYLRSDGRVGTRNYVAVLSTVNCSASVSHLVRDRFRDVTRDYPNVDGVIALTHTSGCGHVSDGEDHKTLERVLAGYARHPNVAAYLIIGLGCEVAQAAPMVERHRLSLLSEGPLAAPVLGIQELGGVRKTVEAAVGVVSALLPSANAARRTRRAAADLILGTNCGGSDSYSGITANPALGWAFDAIVRAGGTGVLGETTELVGAEHLLARRARNRAVAKKLTDRVAWWHKYLETHGAQVNSNPSPGNISGGITTIVEKSLGAVAKSGTSTLEDVVEYAETIREKGFVYMDTPGYDPVSVTGMVAGGANVLCFTTGRGSVFGCKPVPSIKLASNSDLYRRMEDDMDIDCGTILRGHTVELVGRQILDEVLAVASGKRTKSELAGIGEAEFAPWMRGPVL